MSVELKQIEFNSQRQVFSYQIIADGQKVGLAQLRLKPSKGADMPKGFASHVYYEVDPALRGRNYATQALAELKKLAAQHQLDHLVLTANAENAASIKVISKNGGQLAAQGTTKNGQKVLKYTLKIT